ncbi:hypothetical protein [Lacrimispora sp.]|nr:hypothetical protein [Lacrimispora sp.]
MKGKGHKNRRAIFQNDRARESNGIQIINGPEEQVQKESPGAICGKKED